MTKEKTASAPEDKTPLLQFILFLLKALAVGTRNNLGVAFVGAYFDALKRAGRVKGSAAFFGNLMGVKPIIIADANGDQAAYKKVKGRQKSFEEIVGLLKASIVEPENQVVYLTHADCAKEEIDGLVALIKQEIPCIDVEVGFIGPIIGSSIGPDAVGIWGFGQEVTYKIGD